LQEKQGLQKYGLVKNNFIINNINYMHKYYFHLVLNQKKKKNNLLKKVNTNTIIKNSIDSSILKPTKLNIANHLLALVIFRDMMFYIKI